MGLKLCSLIERKQWRMKDLLYYSKSDLKALPNRYRSNLINSITGFKTANLIGTANGLGNTNLAIFNSVMHIGANPAMMGFVLRPLDVPRNTYRNIAETQYFTINAIAESFTGRAHQTSAKYPETLSEFEEVGLEPGYWADFPAPYVKESPIRIGLEFLEDIPFKSNGCRLIIGGIQHLEMNDSILASDGFAELDKANIVSIGGLDAYYKTRLINRFEYARPGKEAEFLTFDQPTADSSPGR